jgi:hypothetical protein
VSDMKAGHSPRGERPNTWLRVAMLSNVN